ncbi:MAG TPA: GNAT family N-acetyltransferase [Stellaceae bacterium]
MIDIRFLGDEDHDVAAHIWSEGRHSTGLAIPGAATEVQLRERMPRELATGWDAHLAWRGAEAVGFLALKIKLQCLDQIFLLPEAQGQGVGRVLFEFACARMPKGFWLRAAFDDKRACGFYEHLGCKAGERARHPTQGYETVVYRWFP